MSFPHRHTLRGQGGAPPSGDKSIGFNFRKSGALSYPAGDNYVGVASSYLFPVNFTNADGDTVEAGWTGNTPPQDAQIYDNTTTVNRLGGGQSVLASFWSVRLPAGSSWRIRVGYFLYVSNALQVEILDGSSTNNTLLFDTGESALAGNDLAIDIALSITTDLVWESNYASVYVDVGPITDRGFADTGMTFRLNAEASGYISHLRLEPL